MEIILTLIGVAIIFWIGKIAYGARSPSGPRHTDEELRNMSFQEWEALNIDTMRSTGTDVLRVYLTQYENLKSRIDSKDAQTMNLLDKQGVERSLASLKIVRDELVRRNAL